MNESKNLITFVGKNSNFNVKNFDTLDEFQNYYNLHKDEIDKLSTIKLNRMFKIKDHKITRRTIGGNETKTLCFRQLLKSELENKVLSERETHDDHNADTEIENTLTELNGRIKQLELDYIKIKKQLVEIINAINV